MNSIINYWAVIGCAVAAMVVGAVWYGPLFGRAWLKVIGATAADLAARREMQKRAAPLYAIQFLLTCFQVFVLAHYVRLGLGGVESALWIWAGFIVPTIAGTAMWNNDSRQVAWARFLIQVGYQLVVFVIFGLILTIWR